MTDSPAELRKVVLAIRSPGGEEPEERIALRYLFMAEVTGTLTVPNRVTVDRHGTDVPARYPSWYSPTIGDLVECEYIGEELVVRTHYA